MAGRDGEQLHVEDAEQWRDWLAAHHGRGTGVWVVWWKRSTGRPAPSYDDLVCEALAQGWIDATSKGLDDERTMMWFTHRRPGSGWSRPNEQRLERWYAEGRMCPAGQAVVDRAVTDGPGRCSTTSRTSTSPTTWPGRWRSAGRGRPGTR